MRSAKRMLALNAAALLTLGALAACGDDEPKRTVHRPSAPASAEGPAVDLGQDVTTAQGTTTLFAFQRPFGTPEQAPAAANQEWLGLRVEACAGDSPREIGAFEWSAYGPAGERYPGAHHGGDWPFGQVPDSTLSAGECSSGWVVIAVIRDAEVTSVRVTDPDGVPLGSWSVTGGAS